MPKNEVKMAVPELPEGWVPEGTQINAVAIYYEDRDHWQSVLPEFSVAGMGSTADEAIQNAVDLLFEYFRLCAAEGRTFQQCYRGMGWRSTIGGLFDAARLIVRAKLRRRRNGYRRERLTLRPAH